MFIVIEGTDGSGKATQTAMLKERLEQEGKKTVTLSFPMYDYPSSALVRHYLNGDFGTDPMAVEPHAAALFYSADRAASAPLWKPAVLDPEVFSIADRYMGSNAIHQAAKLDNPCDKLDFFRWLSDLEFSQLQLPRPDVTIFLNTSIDETMKRMKNRSLKSGEQHDIHEDNRMLQSLSNNTGLMAAKFYGWNIIECGDRSIKDISDEVYRLVEEALKRGTGDAA